jgi:hypothetical protein
MGGYGYYGPGGGWMAYNVMRDVTMMSLLMNNHGYGYGPYDSRPHSSWFGIILGIGILVFIFIIAGIISRRNQSLVLRR